MYCPACGKELRPGASYCPYCGQHIHRTRMSETGVVLARGAAALMGGGLAFACGLSGASLLVAACWLLYHYASGTAAWVPAFLNLSVETVSGAVLLFGGVTAALLALLLGMTAAATLRAVSSIFARR